MDGSQKNMQKMYSRSCLLYKKGIAAYGICSILFFVSFLFVTDKTSRTCRMPGARNFLHPFLQIRPLPPSTQTSSKWPSYLLIYTFETMTAMFPTPDITETTKISE